VRKNNSRKMEQKEERYEGEIYIRIGSEPRILRIKMFM
jgi:hypothetical protein